MLKIAAGFLFVQFGGAEATSFEHMFADLAEWFTDHPLSAWQQELQQTSSDALLQVNRY